MKKTTTSILSLVLFLFCQLSFAQLKTVVQFGHDLPLTELTYSTDGKILASTDGLTVKLWDVGTGMEFKTLYAGEGQFYRITHLQFINGEAPYTIAYLYNKKLIYQDALTDELLEGSSIRKKMIDTLSIEQKLEIKYPNKDKDSVQLKKYFKELSDYNEKGSERWAEIDKQTPYNCIVHDESGNLRASKRVQVYTKKEVDALNKKVEEITDKNKSIAKSNEKRIKKGEQPLPELPIPPVPEIGSRLTVLELFEVKSAEPALVINIDKSVEDVKDEITWDLRLSADGLMLINGSRIYNLNNQNSKYGKEVARFGTDNIQAWSWVEISKNREFIISGNADTLPNATNLFIWEAKNIALTDAKAGSNSVPDSMVKVPLLFKIPCAPVKRILPAADPDYIITLHSNSQLRYWNIRTGKEDAAFFKRFNAAIGTDNFENMNALAVSKASQTVVTGSYSKKNLVTALHVWDIKTGTLAKELGAKIAPVKISAVQLLNDSLLMKEWESSWNIKKDSIIHISQQQQLALGLRQLNILTGDVQSRKVDDKYLFSPSWNYYITANSPKDNKQLVKTAGNAGKTVLQQSARCNEFAFDGQDKFVAGIKGDSVMVWAVSTGKIVQRIGYTLPVTGIAFDDEGNKLLTTCDGNYAEILDLKTMQKTSLTAKETRGTLMSVLQGIGQAQDIKEGVGDVSNKINNPRNPNNWAPKDGDKERAGDDTRDLAGLLNQPSKLKTPYFEKGVWSADGNQLFLWRGNGYEMYHYNFSKPGFDINEPEVFRYLWSFGAMQEGGRMAYNSIPEDKNSFEDDQARELLRYVLEMERMSRYSSINKEWTWFAINIKPHSEKRTIEVTNLTDGKSFSLKDKSVPIGRPYLSPSGRYLAAGSEGSKFQVVRLWDLQNKALIKTFIGHTGEITFSADETKLISSGTDRQMKVWDISTPGSLVTKPLFSFVAIKGTEEYIIYTPEGYYLATRGNTNAIAFQFKDRAYPFEQFDAKFNRPDIVVEALSRLSAHPDTATISLYRDAYAKRIDKMKLDRKNVETPENANPPLAYIAGKDKLPVAVDAPEFEFDIQVSAGNESELKQLDVYDNGVPLYGTAGKTISGKKHQERVAMKLTSGINRIQVRVTDQQGLQSMYDTYELKYNSKQNEGTLYVVNIGLAKYKIEALSLKNITNDMKDWAARFQGNPRVKIIPLHNNEATYTKIMGVKAQLMQTREEDEVIIFYEGHCVGDGTSLTTFDFGSKGSEKTNIGIDELESLLDGIPARKKLLMINACKAGEKQNGPTYRAMRQLYVNLNRDNGSSIIVSSEGAEKSTMNDDKNPNHTVFGKLLTDAIKDKSKPLTVYQLSRAIEQGYTESQHPYAKSINMDANFIIR